MKAELKNYRQSPRKVRLLADLVRGKKVKDALSALQFIDKRAAEPFAKVVRSAEANAKHAGIDTRHVPNLVLFLCVSNKETYNRYFLRSWGTFRVTLF